MLNVEQAVDHLETCLGRKPVCYSEQHIAIPLADFRRLMMKL